MAFWVARESRPFIVLAMASLGLAACSASTPTSPSPLPGSGVAAPDGTSSEAASLGTAGAQTTGADTVKITKGTLAFESRRPGTVMLRGSHGFRFDGSVISGLEPTEHCSVFNPCQPGATVPFALSWVGTDIPGTVRLQGEEYPFGSLVTGSMLLELAGSFVAPARRSDSASVTVPFTVGGLLSRGDPYPALQLTGRGEVTFTLAWQPFIDGWGITSASFDFGRGGGRPD